MPGDSKLMEFRDSSYCCCVGSPAAAAAVQSARSRPQYRDGYSIRVRHSTVCFFPSSSFSFSFLFFRHFSINRGAIELLWLHHLLISTASCNPVTISDIWPPSVSCLPPLVSRRHSIARNNLKSLRRFKRLIITYYIFR